MDVTQNLLVAMMFVMVLSIGIASILTGLTTLADRETKLRVQWLPMGWLALLFLLHLNLFWNTLTILSYEDWVFVEFLYIVVGPVLLLLATSLLLPERASSNDYQEHYFDVAPRMFLLLAFLMVWMLGLDFVFGDGLSVTGAFEIALALLFAFLARSQTPEVHRGGMAVAWAVFLVTQVLEGMKVVE